VYTLGRKRGTSVFRPLSTAHPDDETWPGLLLVRTEGRVFFANAQRIGESILAQVAEMRPSVVAIDFSAVPDLEYTALKMLIEAEGKLRQSGIELWLVALNAEVLAVVDRSCLRQQLGPQRLFLNRESAVKHYQASRSWRHASRSAETAPPRSRAA
jgi:SulP family sulfate permease